MINQIESLRSNEESKQMKIDWLNVSGVVLPSFSARDIQRNLTHVLAILFLALVGLSGGGCVGLASGTLPPKLTSDERNRVSNTRLPLTVGVERTKEGGEFVISKLRKTKLFDAVDYVDRLPNPPTVMAQWEHTPYGRAIIPAKSLLTFGIIPTTEPEPLSFGCTFYSQGDPNRNIKIEYRYETRTTLGWVSVIRALSPNVVLGKPDEHRRFYERLKLTILSQSEDMKRLAN